MKRILFILLILFSFSLFAEDSYDDFEDDLFDDIEDDTEDLVEDTSSEEDAEKAPEKSVKQIKKSVKKASDTSKKKSTTSPATGYTKIATEGYISFLKESGGKVYSPSYITLSATSDYQFDYGFHVSGWFEGIVGFPDKDAGGGYGNLLYNSYGNGGVRVVASYSYKNIVEVGFATTLRFYNASDSNAAPISQGGSLNYNGPRKHYLLQETFILSEPIKGLKLYANFGLNNQNFQIQAWEGTPPEQVDADLVDTNLMLQTLVSYEIIQYVIPYIGVDHKMI